MSGAPGYHNRGIVIAAKISNLLCSLGPATYEDLSPKIEFWIESALTEQSVNAEGLVDHLSSTIWVSRSSDAAAARFLKEFRDAPHRSEQAKSFVDKFCARVLRLFAAASAEDLASWDMYSRYRVASRGGEGFVYAASLVGHLTECGVLDHELVPRYLIKPLIAHHYTNAEDFGRSFRAMAIYQIFAAAKNTLLQGLLEAEDVEACFKTLDMKISSPVAGPDAVKLNVQPSPYLGDSRRNLLADL